LQVSYQLRTARRHTFSQIGINQKKGLLKKDANDTLSPCKNKSQSI